MKKQELILSDLRNAKPSTAAWHIRRQETARPLLDGIRRKVEGQRCTREVEAQVHARQIEPRTANALAYLATSLLRAIEVSDLEGRLEDLEATQQVQERAFLQSTPDPKKKEED